MAKKIDTHILAILAACTFEGPRLYLPGELTRPDYVAVNKVLEANGGKWNKAAKAHVFDEDAADAIEQALATGEFHRVKQDLGQFDTPAAVVARLIELAEIRPGDEVLEPSAGVGNIVSGILQRNPLHVRANEIDEKRRHTMMDRFYNVTEANPDRIAYGTKDFLEVPPRPVFDRVVMNPPFAKQADIDHVTHALQFLRPGGRLVAVMGAGVQFRGNLKTRVFRELVMNGFWETLPEGSFASSGTNVNAVILAVDV